MVFGIRAVIEAIKSGKEIESLFVQRGLSGHIIQELKGPGLSIGARRKTKPDHPQESSGRHRLYLSDHLPEDRGPGAGDL